jgi:hypothetical protein
MPTPTYTPLATVTVGIATLTVTFSNIPSTYKDLILVSSLACTATGDTARLRFNGDTGSNYNWVFINGTGSVASSSSQSNQNILNFSASVGLPTVVGKYNNILQIMDYSATDKHKTIVSRTNQNEDTFPGTTALAGRWASTSAITSMSIFPSTFNLIAGSRLDLYGVIA